MAYMDNAKRDFTKEAAAWDTPPRIKLADDISAAIRGEIKLSRTMDVLDFGCGTGLLALNLQPFVRTVTGIDSSQGMLDVFKSKLGQRGLSNVQAQLWDIEKEGKLPGKYNLIVSAMTFHHIKDIPSLLTVFMRSLRPSGILCIADLDLEEGQFHSDNTGVHHEGFERPALQRNLLKVGFTSIHTTTAATVTKPAANGTVRSFTIFLMTAVQP